jgi:hypothetical protein
VSEGNAIGPLKRECGEKLDAGSYMGNGRGGRGGRGRAYRGQDTEWREGRGGEEGRAVGIACACGQMLGEGREQGSVALFARGFA